MGIASAGHGGAEEVSDWEWVRQSLEGDAEAFGVLVRRYERLVFHVAGGFLRDSSEVEDVAQETFLRAFEALPGFRPHAPFGPWVARIATHLSYDRLRSRRRRPEVAWDDLSSGQQRIALSLAAGGGVDDAVASRDLAERALDRLGPKDRQALILMDGLGYSALEAGRVMSCTALAVRLRAHRARRALRRIAGRMLDGALRQEEGGAR